MLRTFGIKKFGTRNLLLSAQSQNIYFGKTRSPEGIAYGRSQAQKNRDIFQNEIEEKIYKDNMKSEDKPVSTKCRRNNKVLYLGTSIPKQASKISCPS